MSKDVLKGLTDIQKEAVTYDKGPLLVLAGPGAGKTTVLTRRIAYILDKSERERFKILALTFTNKAAKEMRERIEKLFGEEAKRAFIGTFHSFCHELLRAYGQYIGLNLEFTIYDKHEDLIALLIDAVKQRVQEEIEGKSPLTILLERYENARVIENTIPNFYFIYIKLKNKLITPEDLCTINKYSEDFKLIFKIYQEALREANVLDFSDLILYAYKLLKEKPFIVNHLRRIYKHILIDEGQDTNKAQFELIKILCGESFPNLFIVADEDQLIFEWNDAKLEYLIELYNQYNMSAIQLYESFRCPPKVLEIANNLISYNTLRIPSKKPIASVRDTSSKNGSIELNRFKTQKEEADFIGNKIIELTEGGKLCDYNRICVIARNRYVLNEIIKRIDKVDIPHYVPMLQEKFVSREVNFIINMMKLLLNENDRVTFYKICNHLGLNYEEFLEEKFDKSLLEITLEVLKQREHNLWKIFSKFSADKDNFKKYFDELAEFFKNTPQLEEDIQGDIEFFEEVYKSYKREKTFSEESLSDFMSYLALSSRKEGKGVALLTGHASKGLEFEYVFLVSLNQDIWPDYRAINKAQKGKVRELEEERRNCFVAVTRTKKKLFISYVEFKMTRAGNFQSVKPSQFLYEMGLLTK